MIDGLRSGGLAGEHGLEELSTTLREVTGRPARVLAVVKLTDDVHRIVLSTSCGRLSVVAKRLEPTIAHRNQVALERWLPAADLEHAAPALLGVAAERTGSIVWHVYEDLGDSTLAQSTRDPAAVEAAVRLVASLHARFVHDPVLAECSVWGEDHGVGFYHSSVRDALAAITAVIRRNDRGATDLAACRRLLGRLERLLAQSEDRMRALAELAGPETLLHGDLWLKNAAVRTNADGRTVRLIDWDKTGPGSFSYDLSTLVLRFPSDLRRDVIDLYRRAIAEHDIRIPADEDVGALFSTAEYARLANVAIWPARVAAGCSSRWAFEELVAIDEWFEAVEPQCAV